MSNEKTIIQEGSLRLRWAIIVGSMLACIVFLFTLITLTLEENAWQKNQQKQSLLLVTLLSDELKSPMTADSQAEVGVLIDDFLQDTSSARSIELQWRGHTLTQYGDPISISVIKHKIDTTYGAKRLSPLSLWYINDIMYGQSHIGRVAVYFSADAWKGLASAIKTRLFITAFFMVLLSGFIAYWVAGRMSRPIEQLAFAEQRVSEGDLTIRLPVQGHDEITTAQRYFNQMVRELAQKERLREKFNRYLNPKLIEKLFAENGDLSKSHRQDVTVLFADMVNFTSYSQDAEAEDVVGTLNDYFEVFHYIIDYYGGNVDKYMGDAVMAVFNHPFEDKDHIRHAIMAGLCMAEVCQRLALKRPDGDVIQFRIGLNKGEVIVGNIGARKRLEYTVIGDAVNVASRMASLGAGVIVAESVFEQLSYGFEMKDLTKQRIKGISEPILCGNIVPKTRKNVAEIMATVDAAITAKEQAEREEMYYDNH